MYFLILLCAAWIVSCNPAKLKHESITPHDLEDEIRVKLEDLRSLTQGTIFAALDDLDSMGFDVNSTLHDTIIRTDESIRTTYADLTNKIRTMESLAQSSGVDIDVCVGDSFSSLDKYLEYSMDTLERCLQFTNSEMNTVQTDCKYLLNIVMNEVNIFDFQLEVCAGDFLCMAPLVQEIELAMVNIPQKIGVQLAEATQLHEILKLGIWQYSVTALSSFSTRGGMLVAEVSVCASHILP